MNQFQEDPLKSAIHIMDHLILCQERRIKFNIWDFKHIQEILKNNSEPILPLKNSLKVNKHLGLN